MGKRILAKIQVSPSDALPLVAKLHSLGFLDYVQVDTQSPSELAKIEDQRALFFDYYKRVSLLCSELGLDLSDFPSYESEHYVAVSDFKKFQSEVESFLSSHESSLLSLFRDNHSLTKKHLIADKLHYFRHKFLTGDIPLDLLSPGPSTFSTVGEIHHSYEDVLSFYLEELTKGLCYFWTIDSSDPDYRLVFLLTPRDFEEDVISILEEFYFSPIDFELSVFTDLFTEEETSQLTIANVHDLIHEKHDAILAQIESAHNEHAEVLKRSLTSLHLILELIDYLEKGRTTQVNFTFWVWIKSKSYSLFEQSLQESSFQVKIVPLEDVPIKYQKPKKITKTRGAFTLKEDKPMEKDNPPYHFIGHSKGGALFPKDVDFIKIEVPKENTRELISFIHSVGVFHQEKIGRQPESILNEIKEKKQRLTSLSSQIKKYKDLLNLHSYSGLVSDKVVIKDSFEKAVEYVENFISANGEKIVQLSEELKELKTRETHIESILPFYSNFDKDLLENYSDSPEFETFTLLGTVPKKNLKSVRFFLNEVTDGQLYFVEISQFEKNDTAFIYLLSLIDYKSSITQILEEYSFEKFSFDADLLADKSLESKLVDIRSQITKKENELDQLRDSLKTNLFLIEELLDVEFRRLETEERCKTDETTTTMWGWIPKEQINVLKKQVESLPFPLTISEKQKVPLTNPSLTFQGNKVTKVFRGLVDGMGTPSTHEVDPFKIMQFTFPLIFGIMFADVGHGLLLFLIGLYLTYRKNKYKIEPDESMSGYLYKGSELLTLSGFSAMIIGFLFGAILGDEVFLPHFYETVLHIDWLPLLEPTKEVSLFLLVSITIGFLIIQLGIWLRFIENKKYGHGIASWVSPIILSIFYVSLFAILYNLMGAGATSRLLNGGALPAIPKPYSTVFVVIALVSIPLVFLFEFLHEGGDGIMEAIDHLIALFSNTLSFSRILAMLLVHAILSGLPYILLGIDTHHASALSTAWWYWIIGLVWGLVVIVPIEGLFSFLQTLRLHWVEFFSKFYKGEGVQYNPLIEKTKFFQYTTAIGE